MAGKERRPFKSMDDLRAEYRPRYEPPDHLPCVLCGRLTRPGTRYLCPACQQDAIERAAAIEAEIITMRAARGERAIPAFGDSEITEYPNGATGGPNGMRSGDG